ncbi:hypothetical protein [Altibacter sp.]|uniref:hypothetical protein n=1 Tax=Altibacter sp. TaxID=2024823 RepID=UPI000C8CF356|nr:hypothetical protein [Altibacter sp.]MAP54519.1 hypothetical protein [Altibacter sp.]
MKVYKLLLGGIFALCMVSCQFTETMVMQEDGSGRMAIEMDMKEMMAFGAGMDSTLTKTDTIISFKQVFEAKKDSIAQLPIAEQNRLKKMENFMMKLFVDPDSNDMFLHIFTDFKKVKEANELMNGLGESSGFMPGVKVSSEEQQSDSEDFMGVSYSYEKNTFLRDAFIKDKARHQSQLDSLKSAEMFLSGTMYTLRYTFPKKIKRASIEDATYSADGKTIEVERSFLDYMKEPDILDLEVVLEK